MQQLTAEEKRFFFESEKKGIIKKIKWLVDLLSSPRYTDSELIQIAGEIDLKERRLHDEFGMTWEEIEQIEIA